MKKVILLSLAVCLFATACNKNDLEFTKDGLPTNCAPNEIIYKTQYGYPIELKTDNSNFGGAKLVANLCEDGYCKYIFDADITQIPSYSFSGRVSLISMIIPNSVTSIGYYAFKDCTSLKEVYCKPTTPPTGGDYMFSYNDSGYSNGYKPIGCKIYVPRNSVNTYKSASYWEDYASYIEGYDF